MAGLGSNMEVRLNVAEPRRDIFYSFLGWGAEERGLMLDGLHPFFPGQHLLRAYYVLLAQQCEKEPSHRGRQGV